MWLSIHSTTAQIPLLSLSLKEWPAMNSPQQGRIPERRQDHCDEKEQQKADLSGPSAKPPDHDTVRLKVSIQILSDYLA
jgi:hypothetical protein